MTPLLRGLCQGISVLCAARGARGGTLVVQPLPGIGDMIWHLPHLHAIANASTAGSVSLLTKPRSLADRLLSADPAVRRVLWLERNPGRHDGFLGFLRLTRMLRRERFAEVFVLHGSSRLALATVLAGVPNRIGYGRGAQKYLLNHAVILPEHDQKGHPIAKADRLLELLGIPLQEKAPRLPVSEQAATSVGQRYAGKTTPWVAIGIGSSEPLKQWGRERYAELCTALLERAPCSVFLLGGPAERVMADWIATHVRGVDSAVTSVIGAPIDEVAALLSRCRLYIGNDTGVLNIAAAVGTLAVGLFGVSRPLEHTDLIHCIRPPGLDPAQQQGSGMFVDASRGQGMAGITVEQVMAEVESLVRNVG